MNFEWSFNLKVFVEAYRRLGYDTVLDDWNVRTDGKGEIRLDNGHTKSTTLAVIDDSILTVTVTPWNTEVADPKTQNVDLLQTNWGWRRFNLEPEPAPSPEGVAFLGHLSDCGYYPLRIEGEYEEETYGTE